MLTRLTRYFSRSKKDLGSNPNEMVEFPNSTTYLKFEERPSISSSRNSSSCSIQQDPAPAPTFIEVVCNDSQPVYCMDTVPLIPHRGPQTMGVRRSNSLYESAHDEILREKRRVNEAEEGKYKWQEESHQPNLHRTESLESLKWSGRLEQRPPVPARSQDRPWSSLSYHSDREWQAQRYTSTDHYYPAQIHPDSFPMVPSMIPGRPQRHAYDNRSVSSVRTFTPQRTLTPPKGLPNSPRPSRYHGNAYHPAYLLNGPYTQFPTPNGPFFPPKSALRQGPYPIPSPSPTPTLPLTPTPFISNEVMDAPYPQHSPSQTFIPSEDEVPMTRVTRLKEPRRFFRDSESQSDVGIGLGRISGMAASRSVSIRRTKSDVGLSTTSRVQSIQQPQRKPSIADLPPKTISQDAKSGNMEDKENISPELNIPPKPPTRTPSPVTPTHVIKIGKPNGRYKTSTMPVYHLATPDSDSEPSSTQDHQLLPPIDFTSTPKLQEITLDKQGETDKWLEEIVRLTLPKTQCEEVNNAPVENRNTVDIKRHRMFSTRVEVRPRGQSISQKEEVEKEKRRSGGRSLMEDPPTSWIASEIFTIANIQAMIQEGTSKKKVEKTEEKAEVMSFEGCDDEEYREIESLIGDYFEDVKISGSDCSEDPDV